MAWNISVTTFTPRRAVEVGLQRRRGSSAITVLVYNERAVNLYKQLAWIFNNKMGADVDEFHMAYKLNWAWRMHLLLGPPPQPDFAYDADEIVKKIAFDLESDPLYQAALIQDERYEKARLEVEAKYSKPFELGDDPNGRDEREGVMRISPEAKLAHVAAIDFIESIAAAPDTLAELYAEVPETEAMVAALWSLGARISDDRLTEKAYEQKDGLAITFFSPYRQLADPTLRSRLQLKKGADGEDPVDRDLARFDEVVGVTTGNPAGAALVRFLQKKVLVEVYKNDPEDMTRLVRQFGPMDWRLVDTQSLYWATRALILSQEADSSFENDKTNVTRIVLFSLQNMARRNKLFFDPHPDLFKGDYSEPMYASYLNFTPDPAFIEYMHRAYLKFAPRFDPQQRKEAGVGRLFSSGHINFLREGIRTLWFSGRPEAAQRYYDYLRKVYGHHPNGAVKEEYTKDLRDYVVDDYYEQVGREVDAKRAVAGLLRSSFEESVNGDRVRSAALVRQANEIHRRFNKSKEALTIKRMMLPPFMDMYTDEFTLYLRERAFIDLQTLHKARVWAAAPPLLQRRVYDRVRPALEAECEAFDLDVDKAFPEPPDMAQYRAAHPTRAEDVQQDAADGTTLVQPNNP